MAKSDYMATLNGYKIKDNEAIHGLSISSKVITYTKGNGSTGTITTTGDVNQNAFSNVKVGTTTIAAASTTDTFEIVGGTNITVTPNETNKTITIATSANNYTLPNATTTQKGGVIVGDGLSVSSGTISNAGVVSVAEGTTNGTISVKTGSADAVNVAVHGLGSNAYTSTAYAPVASPALTGTPTAPTATAGTNSTQIATTAFVKSAVDTAVGVLADAMIFKGTIGTGGTVTALPATHEAGWTYKVATAGTYAGIVCEVGDMIICVADGTAANNAHWTVVQNNIDGAVTGPTSATVGNIATFSNANGKVVQDGGKSISTTLTTTSDTQVPTSKAVATYVTGLGYKTTDNDTKNTAGSTDTSSKIFLIGATSQAANPQTYSHDTAYVGTDGCLYSGGNKVITDISGKADKASITAGTAGTSSATSGVSISIPYVTTNAQGIVTGYGTHTHTISKTDITGLGIPASDTNTTYSAGTGLSLSGTTFSANQMTGATASAAGTTGRVPAPAAGAQTKFLRGDATWADIALSITDDGAGNIVFGLATE